MKQLITLDISEATDAELTILANEHGFTFVEIEFE